MKFLVVGGGMMGRAVIKDLLNQKDLVLLNIFEMNPKRIEELKSEFQDSRIGFFQGDVLDRSAILSAMEGCDTVISAVYYDFHLNLTRLAIEQGCNFCDLGGNIYVVEEQLKWDHQAQEKGVTVIPDCGLAPGMASVLVSAGSAGFDTLEEIHIRVGGLPQNPTPPLGYKLVFSVNGLINEYKEKAVSLKGGQLIEEESLTGLETLEFPPPFGRLEAFLTSGGTSTLPQTYRGKVKTLDYKTIRYPGHCEKIKLLFDLGFFSHQPLETQKGPFQPREVSEKILENYLTNQDLDSVLVRIDIFGTRDGKPCGKRVQIIDFHDSGENLSAMARCTAFPISIIGQMMSRGQITEKGVTVQEKSVPGTAFIEELRKRGIQVEISPLSGKPQLAESG